MHWPAFLHFNQQANVSSRTPDNGAAALAMFEACKGFQRRDSTGAFFPTIPRPVTPQNCSF